MADITKEQVKDFLSKMTVLELAELTKELEALWGVTAAAPVAMAAMPVAAAAEAVEAQTEFDVILKGFDADKKIAVIKEIRTIVAGLGLKEAKEFVEAAPKVVKEGATKEEAEDIKKKLEAAGAQIEVK